MGSQRVTHNWVTELNWEPESNQLRKEQFRSHHMHGFCINLWRKYIKRHFLHCASHNIYVALDFWNSSHNLQISWQQHWNTTAFANTQSTRLLCAGNSSLLCETTVSVVWSNVSGSLEQWLTGLTTIILEAKSWGSTKRITFSTQGQLFSQALKFRFWILPLERFFSTPLSPL